MDTELRHSPEALIKQAVRAGIRISPDHMHNGSRLLEKPIHKYQARGRRQRIRA